MASCRAPASAKRHLATLRRNTSAFYAGHVGYEEFGKRQKRAWDAIHRAGRRVESAVLCEIRKRLPVR